MHLPEQVKLPRAGELAPRYEEETCSTQSTIGRISIRQNTDAHTRSAEYIVCERTHAFIKFANSSVNFDQHDYKDRRLLESEIDQFRV